MTDKKYSKHHDHMKTTDVQMSFILFPEVILENFIFTVSRSAEINGHIHMYNTVPHNAIVYVQCLSLVFETNISIYFDFLYIGK